jgi:hypothetical protein
VPARDGETTVRVYNVNTRPHRRDGVDTRTARHL